MIHRGEMPVFSGQRRSAFFMSLPNIQKNALSMNRRDEIARFRAVRQSQSRRRQGRRGILL